MCAQFMLKTTLPEIQHFFTMPIESQSGSEWDQRVRGFVKTEQSPVLVVESDQLVLKDMYFSLCPSWSKQFPAAFTSYNARLERIKTDAKGRPIMGSDHSPLIEKIFEIPAWKNSFKQRKFCLVPMNVAIESSYFGTHAGEIVQFHKPNDELFLCLGLWNDWVDKDTGEIKETFTLLTDHPYKFFVETGHDRSVIVTEPKHYIEWLKPNATTDLDQFNWIRKNRTTSTWQARSERKMADGWQKRAPTPLEVLELEVFEQQ